MAETGDAERPAGSLLEGLVAAMPDAVVGTDAEFRVTVWNAGAERLYGYTRGQALGRFARELATLVGDISHVELEAALARDGRVQGELRAQRGDGSIVDVEVFIRRVQGPPGYIGVHRDVTERRVAPLDRRLAASVQCSSDCIALTDLEGRPLILNDAGRRTVGLGSMQVRDVLASERRRIARALHDETLQELSLAMAAAARHEPADDLLEALRRVSQQIRAAVFDLRPDDLEEERFPARLEKLLARHRAIDPRHEIVVELDEAPDHLPGDVSIHLLRILGEALTNARRHAGARRAELRVAMRDEALIASVTDDGHGFTREAVPGHGIAGMRERAELLGGELAVTEPPEGGTIVKLRVPLFERPQAAGPVRVLLVDDHAAIREAMAIAFADDGRFVVAAQAGTVAEARLALEGIDVAIIDLALPDGDGSDLIAKLRAVNPNAQALVLSANLDRSAAARAVEKGAAGVLSKIAHLHEVVGAVRRVLAGETLIPLDEVVELLRLAGREREREQDERRVVETLTAREHEILQLLADGMDGPAIAARLHISPRTQRNHVANILGKLSVHSQLQAVIFGLRHGIVVLQ